MRQYSIHDKSYADKGFGGLTALAVCFLLFGSFLTGPSVLGRDEKKPYSTVAIIDSVLAADSSLQGKVVYVDFWASWCPPCRASFPWMNQLAKRYKDKGLEVVTINLDRKHEAALKFLDEFDNHLKVVYDSTGSLAKLFEIDAMPTSLLYERSGKLHERHQGFKPVDTVGIEDAIDGLLSKEQSK